MRIVVTGATGNVGSALVRALERDPDVDEVVGIARRLPAGGDGGKTAWIAGDVRETDLRPLFTGADAVVHLAWAIQPSRDRDTTAGIDLLGTERVLDAVAHAGVRTLVHASSVAVYAPARRSRDRVTEGWPRRAVASSFYSRDKVRAEELVDAFAREHPDVRTVRLRPAPIVQRAAAEELRRYFFGPLLPSPLIAPGRTPIAPIPLGLWFQVVHADDVADAYRRVTLDESASGAYNVAADPPIGARRLAGILGGVPLPIPGRRVLRTVAGLTWRARLQPTPPGWADLAYAAPLLDTNRLRALGWAPQHDGPTALAEVLAGINAGATGETPPLAATGGRWQELRTGIGARSGV
jgi:nucleoside-diphosphate-sugar epimerase